MPMYCFFRCFLRLLPVFISKFAALFNSFSLKSAKIGKTGPAMVGRDGLWFKSHWVGFSPALLFEAPRTGTVRAPAIKEMDRELASGKRRPNATRSNLILLDLVGPMRRHAT